MYGFVSCCGADSDIIEIIRKNISQQIDVVSCKSLGFYNDTVSEDYLKTVPEKISNAKFFVAVISQNSINMPRFEREISFAYNCRIPMIIVYKTEVEIVGPINLMMADMERVCYLQSNDFSANFKNHIYDITGIMYW